MTASPICALYCWTLYLFSLTHHYNTIPRTERPKRACPTTDKPTHWSTEMRHTKPFKVLMHLFTFIIHPRSGRGLHPPAEGHYHPAITALPSSSSYSLKHSIQLHPTLWTKLQIILMGNCWLQWGRVNIPGAYSWTLHLLICINLSFGECEALQRYEIHQPTLTMP